jgi:hypothetical protein
MSHLSRVKPQQNSYGNLKSRTVLVITCEDLETLSEPRAEVCFQTKLLFWLMSSLLWRVAVNKLNKQPRTAD